MKRRKKGMADVQAIAEADLFGLDEGSCGA